VTADPATLHRRELAHRNIEVALGPMFELLPPQEGDAEMLFDDRHIVVAAANSKWARKRNLKLEQLIDEPWVLPPPNTAVGAYIADTFRAAGVEPPRASVLTYSLPMHRRLLATGRYVTTLPVSMLHHNRDALRMLPVTFPAQPRPVGIMTLRNRTLSPLVHRFIHCARQLAKPLSKA
jgi:DNA-binding transcriptional LysR family regulator